MAGLAHGLLALAALLMAGSPAFGQAQDPANSLPATSLPAGPAPTPSPGDAAAAERAFTRGLLALRGGQLEEAAGAFETAYRHLPRPETLLNLGIARTRQGRPGQALQALERYLQTADPVRDSANLQAVRAEVARIRATATTLQLALTPADAQVRVDGLKVPRIGTDGHELVVSPGRHRIDVRAPGFAPYSQPVDLPAGRFSFALALVAEAGAAPALAPTQPTSTQATPSSAVPLAAAVPPPEASTGDPAGLTAPADTASALKGPPADDTGPRIAPHALLGAPHAIGLGLAVRLPPYFGLSLEAQWLPTVTASGAEVSSQLWSASARVHPFRNGFFISTGLALMRINATVDREVASGSATLNLPSVSFGLGYASEGSGLYLGIDAAVLIELAETELVSPTYDNPEVMAASVLIEGQVQDAIDDVREILPVLFQVNLFRIGYAF